MDDSAGTMRNNRQTGICPGLSESAMNQASGADGLRSTILIIHGVGDAPSEKTRKASEDMICARVPEGSVGRVVWYDWNEAVDTPVPVDTESLTTIAYATRLTARLEYPEHITGRGPHTWFWRLEHAVEQVQLPTMMLFIVTCLWFGLAWAANVLHEEPPPLALGVRLRYLLFPPLDPVLLERSIAAAPVAVYATALALVLVAVLQIVFATASGAVPFRVSLRAALLNVTRPLLALLTAPGHIVLWMAFLASGLAFLLAIIARPVQVVELDGGTVFWGGDRLGMFLFPVALAVASGVLAVVSFLLRGFLKVVSDIVRYLGDPEYRRRIHSHLGKTLTSLEAGPVVVVAHSLGSVIAVDSLLSWPEAWSRYQSVRLLTCGSPLRRLFRRFFPDSYPAPAELASRLARLYGNLRWRNVFRPLDYVGGRLSDDGSVNETRFRQRHHLHIAYWTDRQLADAIAEEVSGIYGVRTQTSARDKTAELSLIRFRYGTLGNPLGFRILSRSLLAAGILLLVAVQAVWIPRLEQEHLHIWHARLKTEGADGVGKLCPQRELDTTGEFPGFERAVAGISFTTQAGKSTLEAYAQSRPDIDWDEVQRAVFGRVPYSPLVAGLRYLVFLKDPLLEVRDCQDVSVRYAKSDPRIFSLPEKFHTSPTLGIFTRIGRILLLTVLWLIWWGGLVHVLIGAALGVWLQLPFSKRDAETRKT